MLASVVRVKVGERREMREERVDMRRLTARCERQELAQGLGHTRMLAHALEASQQLIQ